MLLEHCLVPSQIKCCIRRGWKTVVCLHSKLSEVCQFLCSGMAVRPL